MKALVVLLEHAVLELGVGSVFGLGFIRMFFRSGNSPLVRTTSQLQSSSSRVSLKLGTNVSRK